MTERANKEIVKRIYELFNRGDLDALWDLLADDVTYIDASGTIYDKNAARKLIDSVLEIFPDCKARVDRMIAQGKTVIVEYSDSATHTKEVHGIPPTNKKIEWSGVDIWELQAGKIKFYRNYSNPNTLMQQLRA